MKPADLLSALKELEQVEDSLSRVANYSSLLYSADSMKAEYQDLDQRVEQRVTEIRNILLFFELEWLELPDDAAARCQRAPELKNYTHYLTSIRRFPFLWSEMGKKKI